MHKIKAQFKTAFEIVAGERGQNKDIQNEVSKICIINLNQHQHFFFFFLNKFQAASLLNIYSESM